MKHDVQSFLPTLAQRIPSMPEKVKAIYGITMIHRGSRQLGFTVTELPKGLFSRFTQLYLKTLLYVLHPNGRDRLKLKSELLSPRIATISTEELYKNTRLLWNLCRSQNMRFRSRKFYMKQTGPNTKLLAL